jgi:hypothetical protein
MLKTRGQAMVGYGVRELEALEASNFGLRELLL